ncbi:hypothetical protein OKW33_002487 [Paraburkholderia atlantica]|nr:hypothetical protein [Paraburkholderia atlantica]MPW06090.1 hypothetical protein [Paraburkholderia atlantica]NUY33514.1 hypothetical protein [Paraburkholderia atlantica]
MGDAAEEPARTEEMTGDSDAAPEGAAIQTAWVAASRHNASRRIIEWRGERGLRHRNKRRSNISAALP